MALASTGCRRWQRRRTRGRLWVSVLQPLLLLPDSWAARPGWDPAAVGGAAWSGVHLGGGAGWWHSYVWRFLGSVVWKPLFTLSSFCIFCVDKSVLACVLSCFSRVRLCATLWTVGSSVHGILQARILEWVAIFFSRGSSPPKDGT